MKIVLLAILLPCTLVAQVPPNFDPSQVDSAIVSCNNYFVRTTDGVEHNGVVNSSIDANGYGTIITYPLDRADVTTTLVSPGLSVTYPPIVRP